MAPLGSECECGDGSKQTNADCLGGGVSLASISRRNTARAARTHARQPGERHGHGREASGTATPTGKIGQARARTYGRLTHSCTGLDQGEHRPHQGNGHGLTASESKGRQGRASAYARTRGVTHYSAHGLNNSPNGPSTVATHERFPLFRLPYDALQAYITKRLSPSVTTK